MLKASLLNFKYHRLLVDFADVELTTPLKRDFDYSFIISYGDFTDPEYNIVEKNACLLELEQGMDKLFSNFNHTCRKQIRRTFRLDEFSFHSQPSDFEELYHFYKRCEQERDWYPIPEEELKNSFVNTISYKDRLISGMSCYSSGNTLRLGRIFSRRRDSSWEDVPTSIFSAASRRIVYEFCQLGIQNGFKTLDLGGIDLKNSEKAGIGRFKLSFGAQIVPVKIGRFEKPEFTAQKTAIQKMGYDIT